DNANRIIRLKGTGLQNGFALRKADGSYLNNIDATKIRWNAKFDHDFLIYVSLELDDGNVTHLSYRARDYRNHPDVLPFVLPEITESGLWETTTRDLSKDLHKYLPKRSIASVLDFEVRGGGDIANVTLVVDDTEDDNNTDDDDNITDPDDGDDNNNTDPDDGDDNNITDPDDGDDNNITDPGDTNNTIPVADPGEDQLVTTTGTVIVLDGNGSYDADNDPLTYNWTMTGKPFGSSAVLTDDTTIDPTFTSDKEGSYIIELIVNDGTVDSNASTVTVRNVPCMNHNGFDYCPVASADTARIWLDRNLGAAQVCNDLEDIACYGDYYQWGRNFDGHQDSTSDTNTTQAADVDNAGDKFIVENNDWASTDLNGSTRSANWSKTDGNSICPVGYKVPTLTELADENINVTDSFLLLPFAGYRDINGTVGHLDPGAGHLWSSDAGSSLDSSKSLTYDDRSTYEHEQVMRAIGLSIRCIKK
ncbi:MAG: hypothetical protein J7J02_03530, partial [Sulfurovum sp.]|nr:hypothetical protein [Sulfurovum sp.]